MGINQCTPKMGKREKIQQMKNVCMFVQLDRLPKRSNTYKMKGGILPHVIAESNNNKIPSWDRIYETVIQSNHHCSTYLCITHWSPLLRRQRNFWVTVPPSRTLTARRTSGKLSNSFQRIAGLIILSTIPHLSVRGEHWKTGTLFNQITLCLIGQ